MVAAVVVEVLLVRGGAIVGQGLRIAAVSSGYLRIYIKQGKIWDYKYSEGSNSEHSNSEPIRIPNVFKFGFQMVKTKKRKKKFGF